MPAFVSPRLASRLAALAVALTTAVAGAAESTAATGTAEPISELPSPHRKSAAEKVDGLWCGTGLLHEFSLRLSQQYQELQGTLSRKHRVRQIHGHMEGRTLYTQATKVGSLVLELTGDELRIVGGEGRIALVRGMAFKRSATERCGR